MVKLKDVTIHCTGDVVTGDIIQFNEAVFGGSFRKPKYLGDQLIFGKVIKDSYGAQKQQHTFTIEIMGGDLKIGTKIRRKGRNVYKNGTQRAPWDDEAQRLIALDEKHGRGDKARAARQHRIQMRGY